MGTPVVEREAKRAERAREIAALAKERIPSATWAQNREIAETWIRGKGRERYSYHGIALDLFVEECLKLAQPKQKKPRQPRPYVLYAVSVMHTEEEGYLIAFCQARDAREARQIISMDALRMGYTAYQIRMVEKMKVKQGTIKYF